MSKKKLLVAAAATACLAVAAAALILLGRQGSLALRDGDTGALLARYPLEQGEEFSITFIHSVNQTPVTDCYDVNGEGLIVLRKTIYYDFGAGVPSDLPPETELSYDEETGAMVVSGIDQELPQFYLFVGTVSDHTLAINGDEISLRDLCGRNTKVHFSYEETFPFFE